MVGRLDHAGATGLKTMSFGSCPRYLPYIGAQAAQHLNLSAVSICFKQRIQYAHPLESGIAVKRLPMSSSPTKHASIQIRILYFTRP
jgi:hypothetical protein